MKPEDLFYAPIFRLRDSFIQAARGNRIEEMEPFKTLLNTLSAALFTPEDKRSLDPDSYLEVSFSKAVRKIEKDLKDSPQELESFRREIRNRIQIVSGFENKHELNTALESPEFKAIIECRTGCSVLPRTEWQRDRPGLYKGKLASLL